MRGAPGGTHGLCTAPHAAHTGTHIRSPSQPAASGPWAEPGAHSSPLPPSHGMPGMDTPRWSPAPPALEHRCEEGRTQAREKGARTVRYPHYSRSLCCWRPGRAPQPTVCPLLSCLCPCSHSLLARREETLGNILVRLQPLLQLLSYHLSILGNQQIHMNFCVCVGMQCIVSSLHIWSVSASTC